jgi:magnesium-transporting ATPase (P-type)
VLRYQYGNRYPRRAPLPTSLAVVLQTAREDYVRHRDDARANSRATLIMRGSAFQRAQWRDVRVGDVVKVMRGEEFPADMVFLAAGHEDPEQRGLCHVQTAQLDGETNLKLRKAHEAAVPLFERDEDCGADRFRGRIECEQPTEHFGKFVGVLFTEPPESGAPGLPLDANSTLLRGCVLRNVDFVYGMVIYTGNETKVRVKQQTTSGKKAAI